MKCSISNIANVISESIPNPAESGFDIFVGLEHYDSGEVKVTRYGSTQNLVTAVKVFRKGDILLARRNVYLKRAGLVDFDGVTSGDSIVLRVKDDLSSLSLQSEDIRMYLPFVLNTEEFWNYAEKYSDGTMSKRLSPKTLLQYEFDIPDDVTEKNRLLWQAYKTKESYKAMITATDEMVKSQFIEMFGDIKTTSFPVYKLGEICDIHRGGSPRPISEYITNDPDGLNWIKIGDADEGMYISHTAEKIKPSGLNKTRKVYAGDLLLSNSMSFGRPYILRIDGCIHDGWLVLHFNHKNIEAEYLCSYLSQDSTYQELSKLAAGGVVNNLNSEVVKILPTILPPIEEQREYLAVLHQADKSKFELKQAIEKIDKVMRALMQ